MATNAEKEELMQALKFTPRTYKISMWGYGGEKVMGTVKPEVWDYCLKHRIDLVDMAWGDYDEIVDERGLDPDMLPFTPGSWYECDDMAHVSGVSRSSGTIQIEDENGKTIFEKHFDDCDGCEDSPQWSCQDEVWIGMRKKGEVVFVGSSNEKGTFFEGEIELRAPFDIEKLELYYDEVDGEEIINCAYYDGEEIENWGGSTDGKSSDMDMVRVIDDQGNWERYVVPDEDAELPESACTSEVDPTWNPVAELEKIVAEFDETYGNTSDEWTDDDKTDWYPVSVKPHHKGTYECEFETTTWPWPIERMCEWTGTKWLESDGEPAKGIKQWRGLTEEIN